MLILMMVVASWAQESVMAATVDGRAVILFDDGTWRELSERELLRVAQGLPPLPQARVAPGATRAEAIAALVPPWEEGNQAAYVKVCGECHGALGEGESASRLDPLSKDLLWMNSFHNPSLRTLPVAPIERSAAISFAIRAFSTELPGADSEAFPGERAPQGNSAHTAACGAATQDGTACKRTVDGGGYCYQHRQ